MKLVAAALLAAPALALAQAADPQPEELLQIVFPTWADEEGGRVQSIATSAVTRGWDTRQGKKRNVIVAPGQVLRVAQDRIVLLAAMTPAGDSGEPQVAHGTPVGLAAYIFKPGKNGWQLAKRQEPFDLQGFEGRAQMEAVPLSASAQALHVRWGSCWQGHCVDLFALYAIGADGVKPQPLLLQKIKGGNVYSRPDCVDRLGGIVPGMAQADGRDEQVPPGQCYAIEGRWEVAGLGAGTGAGAGASAGTAAAKGASAKGAAAKAAAAGPLTLHFTGAISKASKQGNAPAQRIDQTMKFEFRGGRYVPVSGSNPIPDA